MKKILIKSLCTLGIFAHCMPSLAGGTNSNSMTNTVTVASTCSITATGFTTVFDPSAPGNTDVTASVSTTCTNGAAVTITLGQGANPAGGSSGSVPLRQLSNGAGAPSYITYAMFQDVGRTVIWGNTLATSLAVTGSGSPVSSTAYVRIPSGQSSTPGGTYTDSVLATVTF